MDELRHCKCVGLIFLYELLWSFYSYCHTETLQRNLWNVFDGRLGHKPRSYTIIQLSVALVLKNKMHRSQKQHSFGYRKIVKIGNIKGDERCSCGQLWGLMDNSVAADVMKSHIKTDEWCSILKRREHFIEQIPEVQNQKREKSTYVFDYFSRYYKTIVHFWPFQVNFEVNLKHEGLSLQD